MRTRQKCEKKQQQQNSNGSETKGKFIAQPLFKEFPMISEDDNSFENSFRSDICSISSALQRKIVPRLPIRSWDRNENERKNEYYEWASRFCVSPHYIQLFTVLLFCFHGMTTLLSLLQHHSSDFLICKRILRTNLTMHWIWLKNTLFSILVCVELFSFFCLFMKLFLIQFLFVVVFNWFGRNQFIDIIRSLNKQI